MFNIYADIDSSIGKLHSKLLVGLISLNAFMITECKVFHNKNFLIVFRMIDFVLVDPWSLVRPEPARHQSLTLFYEIEKYCYHTTLNSTSSNVKPEPERPELNRLCLEA